MRYLVRHGQKRHEFESESEWDRERIKYNIIPPQKVNLSCFSELMSDNNGRQSENRRVSEQREKSTILSVWIKSRCWAWLREITMWFVGNRRSLWMKRYNQRYLLLMESASRDQTFKMAHNRRQPTKNVLFISFCFPTKWNFGAHHVSFTVRAVLVRSLNETIAFRNGGNYLSHSINVHW